MVAAPLSTVLSERSYSRVNQVNRRRRNRPESGRTADDSYAVGATWADSSVEFDLAEDALFSQTVVFSTGAEGVIFHSGSSTLGALVAVADNVLIARCGNGASPPRDDTARATLSLNLIPKEQRVKLSVYFARMASGLVMVNVWINGRLMASSASSITATSWSDAGSGGFVAINGTTPVEPTLTAQAYSVDAPVVNDLFYFEGSGGSASQPVPPPQPGPVASLGYMGIFATNTPATVPIDMSLVSPAPRNSLATQTIGALDTIQVSAGPSQLNDFLIILVPMTFAVVRIAAVEAPTINEFSAYTETLNVRQIDGVQFKSYALGPLNAGLTFNRLISTVLS